MASEANLSRSGGLRTYALVAAPLVVFVIVAWLAELALRPVAGSESAAQLAPGLAGVVSGLLTVRLARDSSERDEDEAPVPEPPSPPGAAPALQPPSATTRALWILAAGLGFAACDLVAMLVGVGSLVLAPIDADLSDTAWFDALSRRSIVVFALLALAVAYMVSLRLREGTARGFAIAIGLYLVVNSTQNLVLGGEIDAQWIAWAFGYVLAAATACCIGDAVARRRRASFDAARAARAAVRGGR
jgi:hypothetical protein